jgi:GINS complex subunit 1
VRAVTREVRALDGDASAILVPFAGSFTPADDPAAAVSLLVDHLCMRRNKRCLLAYHRTRLDRLEEMVWRGEDVLLGDDRAPAGGAGQEDGQQQQQQQRRREDDSGMANGQGTASGTVGEESGKSSLSPEEEEYVRRYEDLLGSVKGQWTDIDLSGSLEPPRDLFVDVRVLEDVGEIQTEYGYVLEIQRLWCHF